MPSQKYAESAFEVLEPSHCQTWNCLFASSSSDHFLMRETVSAVKPEDIEEALFPKRMLKGSWRGQGISTVMHLKTQQGKPNRFLPLYRNSLKGEVVKRVLHTEAAIGGMESGECVGGKQGRC